MIRKKWFWCGQKNKIFIKYFLHYIFATHLTCGRWRIIMIIIWTSWWWSTCSTNTSMQWPFLNIWIKNLLKKILRSFFCCFVCPINYFKKEYRKYKSVTSMARTYSFNETKTSKENKKHYKNQITKVHYTQVIKK